MLLSKYNLAVIFFILLGIDSFCNTSDTIKKSENIPVAFTSVHAGYLIKNYPGLPDSKRSIFTEAGIAFQTQGQKIWHRSSSYPQIGISFIYGDYNNNKILGRSMSLLPHFTFILNKNANYFAEIKTGTGFTYFTKHFDAVKNPDNLYIGSGFTNVSFASVNFSSIIRKRIAISAGISVFHFSNGHVQLPNVGMNIPAINAGMKYYFHEFSNEKPAKEKVIPGDTGFHIAVRTGLGIHEFGYTTFPTGGPKYPVYDLSFYVQKKISHINIIQLGINYNYYSSFRTFIETEEIFKDSRVLKSSSISLFAGHEFLFGKFGFVAQAGINLYNPFIYKYIRLYNTRPSAMSVLKSFSSNRLGVHFYPVSAEVSIRNKICIGIYIKSNLGQADFTECALIYTF